MRSETKLSPDGPDGTPAPPSVPDQRRRLEFSSGSLFPPEGVDPELVSNVSALRATGRDAGYGFILLNEHLTKETRAELEGLGLTLLGPHSNAHKAKLPLNIGALRQIADLSYVEWIGYSGQDQKVETDLQAILSSESMLASPTDLPVIINLFDDDPDGVFKAQLEAVGAVVGTWDPDLFAYRTVASPTTIAAVARLDFVLFIELVRPTASFHDESVATIGGDYIRPGAPGSTFDGSSTILGIMDSGFMVGSAAATPHIDLSKWGCGINFTTDAADVWNDQAGHGTHVLGTVMGSGFGDSRFRGIATGIANTQANSLRAAKVFTQANSGLTTWTQNAMDYMDDASDCSGDSRRPQIVHYSGGSPGFNLPGTDATSRKLDEKVWSYRQLYVISAGNDGPGSGTVGSPAVAKNALAVGNVFDFGNLQVGDINAWDAAQCAANGAGSPCASSRGPTGDGRMKPNVVAPGTWVTSANAGTVDGYRMTFGTSMSAPHVTGLAATLMQHYAEFQTRPDLIRAYLMATAIPHDDATLPSNNTNGGRNTYGLGRIAAYASHWADLGSEGWFGAWSWGTVTNLNWIERDITVESGTDRLVVGMTWDEPAASAGAAQAVIYDLDLWVDFGADCIPDEIGQCGEWASLSTVDNVEYVVINDPSPGTYRLKAIPWNAPGAGLPSSIAANVIVGDPTPILSFFGCCPATVRIGDVFGLTTTVSNPAYVASGVHLERTSATGGATPLGVETTREDGVNMDFGNVDEVTLGNIRAADSRTAVWAFRADSLGLKLIGFRSWSENGGTQVLTLPVTVAECIADPDCDDGAFCNGAESCSAGTCQTGLAPSCSDGVACTVDSCDEGSDSCEHMPVNASCDDGQFCNGSETCSATSGCGPGGPPCAGETCDEASDTCQGICADGLDNDGDGVADFPDDPGCADATDNSERDSALPCDDGIDNDGDGRIDFDPVTAADPAFQAGTGDPGCWEPLYALENPECQDGINNDSAIGTDFDGGLLALGAGNENPDGPDPDCVGRPFRATEKPPKSCALGFELAWVLPGMWWLRTRRRRRIEK